MPTLSPLVALIVLLLLVLLAAAWILLPFAMFGIKPLLRELIHEQRLMRQLLERDRRAG